MTASFKIGKIVVPKSFPGPAPDLTSLCAPPDEQGSYNDCVIGAGVNSVQFLLRQMGAPFVRLSMAYPYRFARMRDNNPGVAVTEDIGADQISTIQAGAAHGFCEEDLYLTDDPDVLGQAGPSPTAIANGKTRCILQAATGPCTLNVLKACLFAKTPPIAGFLCFPEYDDPAVYASGIIPAPTAAQIAAVKAGTFPTAHEVMLVAVDEDKKLVKFMNSDGTNFGRGGFGWLPFQLLFDKLFTLGPLYVIQKIGPHAPAP